MSPQPPRKKTPPRPKRNGRTDVSTHVAGDHSVAAGDSQAGWRRLQKVLAAAGLGSRRRCEELILSGRVEVDRHVVSQLGVRVDPQRQTIRVDGEALPQHKRVVLAVHKPKGVVSTNRDPAGRPRIVDLLPEKYGRLFPIGRLDLSSEGLILATNDGDLANELTHPRYGVEKTYLIEVAGQPQGRDLARLERGVHLAEGIARAVSVKTKKRRPHSTLLEVVLDEGRNREIRRLLASIGHKVLRLVRIAVGPIRLGDMPAGAYRPLHRDEVKALRNAVGRRPKSSTPRRGPGGGPSARAARPGPAKPPAKKRMVVGGDSSDAARRPRRKKKRVVKAGAASGKASARRRGGRS